ncbi:SGNH hydrolase-type esterase domain-containing protein [Jimgerdemannia flammicorona]|uniref:SGNH hydrolase-type esterase domain-containing protein n=1 Tax=Jimgerdemannia flammicorona TaxID=994334 RepID=A0A433DKH1_9FUNG|nr:SGNH hydrolase-type esterase domain-containing protein [Jimgerdemannia flammicorona]
MASTKHVLLFGDSLTQGYTKSGRQFHPYGKKLQTLFDAANLDVQVTIEGLSGDRVKNPRWQQRLKNQLEKMQKNEIAYRAVVILGGINDVFQTSATSQNIFDALCATYRLCEEFGVGHVIGCSLMEVDLGRAGDEELKRVMVNELLRSSPSSPFAGTKAPTTATRFTFFELSDQFPLHRLSPEDKKLYWDDRAHCTTAGYDRMGELVFEALRPLLSEMYLAQLRHNRHANDNNSNTSLVVLRDLSENVTELIITLMMYTDG